MQFHGTALIVDIGQRLIAVGHEWLLDLDDHVGIVRDPGP